jgi:hypothetical protein
MRVNDDFRSHEGAQRHVRAGLPWRGGGTTWGTSHPGHLMQGINKGRTSQRGGVMVDAMYNNSVSGAGRNYFEGSRGVGLGCSALLQTSCSFRGVQVGLESAGGMVGKNPFGTKGNHRGHPPRRLGGDRGAGISREEEVEVRLNGQGDEDPEERWFRQDNSRAETCTLTRLEGDLNLALLFEQGGGQRASQLWITRILMGRLSRERTTMGKAMEVFAKLQRRDIMRSMVKLHDLLDLVEPPWRGMAKASSSGQPWDEAMELDEAMENMDEEVTEAPNNPGEANLGLG